MNAWAGKPPATKNVDRGFLEWKQDWLEPDPVMTNFHDTLQMFETVSVEIESQYFLNISLNDCIGRKTSYH